MNLDVADPDVDGGLRESWPPAGSSDQDGEKRPSPGLSREIGVLMVVAGIGGILLPGPIGTPFLILGGVILCPGAFERVEVCLEKRFPRMHRHGMRQIDRFLSDLDRRYPLPK
jgi:hypothetical protein